MLTSFLIAIDGRAGSVHKFSNFKVGNFFIETTTLKDVVQHWQEVPLEEMKKLHLIWIVEGSWDIWNEICLHKSTKAHVRLQSDSSFVHSYYKEKIFIQNNNLNFSEFRVSSSWVHPIIIIIIPHTYENLDPCRDSSESSHRQIEKFWVVESRMNKWRKKAEMMRKFGRLKCSSFTHLSLSIQIRNIKWEEITRNSFIHHSSP